MLLKPDAILVADSELHSPDFKLKETLLAKTKSKTKHKKPSEIPQDFVEQDEQTTKKHKKHKKEDSHLGEMISALQAQIITIMGTIEELKTIPGITKNLQAIINNLKTKEKLD